MGICSTKYGAKGQWGKHFWRKTSFSNEINDLIDINEVTIYSNWERQWIIKVKQLHWNSQKHHREDFELNSSQTLRDKNDYKLCKNNNETRFMILLIAKIKWVPEKDLQ